jgi:hypothetical protein
MRASLRLTVLTFLSFLSFAVACGGAQTSANGGDRDEPGSPRGASAVARGRTLAPPPPGCRPLTAREMPIPRFVGPVGAREGIETEIFTAGGRLVVFQYPHPGPVRGEMFDPVSDTWIEVSHDGAPRFGTFDEGSGPLGGTQFFAFEDWVVATWFDGNHQTRFSGAVFDARENRWTEMRTEGMPDQLPEALDLGTGGVYVRLARSGNEGHRYDVRANRWAPLATAGAPSPRLGAAVVAASGYVFVWGGTAGAPVGDGAFYDVRTDRWAPMSAASAPSPRLAPYATEAGPGIVVWAGRADQVDLTQRSDGAIYDRVVDTWTAIPATGAPDPTIGGLFPGDVAWTGEALLYRELPGQDRGSPRRLAFHDPTVGEWWRTSALSHARVVPLAFGRVLLLDPRGLVVVRAREKLECPVPTPDVPVFAGFGDQSQFAALTRIGDETIVWGRVDSRELHPCPPGAPCLPSETVSTPYPTGVVLSP